MSNTPNSNYQNSAEDDLLPEYNFLTWNCKHIANAQIQRKLSEICFDFGYQLPIICTPYELMGE